MSEHLNIETVQALGKDFSLILDDHLNSMARIYKLLLFPEEQQSENPITTYNNQPFIDFLAQEHYEKAFSYHDLGRMRELHDTLARTTQSYIEAWQKGGFPLANFDELIRLSDEFTLRLRRLEIELTIEEYGLDPLTGLRNLKVMYRDLERELSACARRQDYIGITLGRIDQFSEIKNRLDQNQIKALIKEIAKVLKQTMRVYDEGYRFQEGAFVFCFKHTDRLGSVSAVERFVKRLKNIQAQEDKPQIFQQLPYEVTLSYSIAKLEVGEDIPELIRCLNEDVDQYPDENELILELREFSPVQKYLKNQEDQY